MRADDMVKEMEQHVHAARDEMRASMAGKRAAVDTPFPKAAAMKRAMKRPRPRDR
jgi:hypothetical protein